MRYLTDSEQQLAAKILEHHSNPQTLDGAQSRQDAEAIIAWVKSNPHFAIRIATMAHACHWQGCDCVAHRNAVEILGDRQTRKLWSGMTQEQFDASENETYKRYEVQLSGHGCIARSNSLSDMSTAYDAVRAKANKENRLLVLWDNDTANELRDNR